MTLMLQNLKTLLILLYFNNVHKLFTHVSRNWLINVTLHIKYKIMSWEKKDYQKLNFKGL